MRRERHQDSRVPVGVLPIERAAGLWWRISQVPRLWRIDCRASLAMTYNSCLYHCGERSKACPCAGRGSNLPRIVVGLAKCGTTL
jgi:hypothetical protein